MCRWGSGCVGGVAIYAPVRNLRPVWGVWSAAGGVNVWAELVAAYRLLSFGFLTPIGVGFPNVGS